MEGNLVIVESPTKAGTIQKFLGKGYTVKASRGHIRDLQEKQLGIDIPGGFTPEYVIPDDKKRIVADLSALAAQADTVWLASDKDREGEAISWHLSETLKLDPAKTKRIAFHEITKDAIQHAIENPRQIDMNLVNAQQARRVLDRLVGFELSPILWKKIGRGLSAGRVQSVTLRLVVDREREIKAFTPEPYYRIDGKFSNGAKTMLRGALDARFKTAAEAEKFLQDSIGASYRVASVEKTDGSRWPAPPFTTSTLQQEASRKLRFSVSNTMRIAQTLYERGLITYMRTDSTNLSSLAINTAKQFICDNFGPQYSRPHQFATHSKGAQEAHEAIRPTFIANTDIEGSAQEKALYNLIWKRTVASQMAEAKLLNTSIVLASDKRPEKFISEASEVLFDGFLKLYMEGSDDETEEAGITLVPEVNEGMLLTASEITAECRFTKAPQRYTQASLIKKMEELGIGRPSTYSPTISTLTSARGYIATGDKEGIPTEVVNFRLKGSEISSSVKKEMVGADRGKFIPQDVGILVTDYLVENFPDIMDYNYTAGVEENLDSIAEGKEDWRSYLGEIYPGFHQTVEDRLHDGKYNHVERLIGVDPADGMPVYARFGQYGAYVQKGEGEYRRFASLQKGQLIDSISLEDALHLLALPRVAGSYEGVDVVVTKGKFGPYIKYGDLNVTLPRKADPLTVSLQDCISLIDAQKNGAAQQAELVSFPEADIVVLEGRYGPYIKHAGKNFRIPKGKNPRRLTLDDCRLIISGSATKASGSRFRRFKKQ